MLPVVVDPAAPPVMTVKQSREVGFRANHSAKYPFEHLESVAKAVGSAFLEDMTMYLSADLTGRESVAFYQPIEIGIAVAKGNRRLNKKTFKIALKHEENIEDKVAELVARFPKLLWQLKKAIDGKRADQIHFFMSFYVTENSAKLSDINDLLVTSGPK